jgi:hypothetical protein
MRKPIRRGLIGGAAVLAVAFATFQHLGSAQAYEQPADDAEPQTMEQFLTTVTKDVDAYWTSVFEDNGLAEPRVSYAWIPAGRAAASACGGET